MNKARYLNVKRLWELHEQVMKKLDDRLDRLDHQDLSSGSSSKLNPLLRGTSDGERLKGSVHIDDEH